MKLQKFENVDVIASLEAIMKQNTAFYQSDFDIDKQILRKAAVSLIPEDKRLLWFSRPSGTCCFRERDVFLKDTRQHNTWRFYGEQTRDTILAYAVELILSRLVDTFFSRISPTMQLPPKHHSIAYVLPWAEGLHWQSRSSGCSNS